MSKVNKIKEEIKECQLAIDTQTVLVDALALAMSTTWQTLNKLRQSDTRSITMYASNLSEFASRSSEEKDIQMAYESRISKLREKLKNLNKG